MYQLKSIYVIKCDHSTVHLLVELCLMYSLSQKIFHDLNEHNSTNMSNTPKILLIGVYFTVSINSVVFKYVAEYFFVANCWDLQDKWCWYQYTLWPPDIFFYGYRIQGQIWTFPDLSCFIHLPEPYTRCNKIWRSQCDGTWHATGIMT